MRSEGLIDERGIPTVPWSEDMAAPYPCLGFERCGWRLGHPNGLYEDCAAGPCRECGHPLTDHGGMAGDCTHGFSLLMGIAPAGMCQCMGFRP